jgi:hypothetical protein
MNRRRNASVSTAIYVPVVAKTRVSKFSRDWVVDAQLMSHSKKRQALILEVRVRVQ